MLTGGRWASVRNQYFKYLSEQCQHINPRGIALNENTVTLPLDAVYVSLRAEHKVVQYSDVVAATIGFSAGTGLSSAPDSDFAEEVAETQHNESSHASGSFDIGRPVSEFRLKSDSVYHQPEMVTRKMELYEVVQRERLAVLLGAPGAGKTTLTRFVTARFAEACRAGKPDVTDKPGNSYGDTRLPILLRVASYAEALDKDRNLSLRAFLSRPFHDTGIADVERAAFFDTALQQGKALVLLDGLDEVASGANRADIASKIESFVSGLEAGCRVLVTSRIVGYREARLRGAFAEYQMLDMDDAQVQEFLNRWCVEVEKSQTPGAGETKNRRKGLEESGRLQAAIRRSEGVRKLATNPLLLTILARIHRNQKHLPERRVELYRMALDTLLREWRPAQTGMKNVEVTEAEAETLLLPLAYEMHNRVDTGLLDREEARKLLCRFYATAPGMSPKDHAVRECIDGFLKRVEEHSGLLVMHSTGTVGFLHLTFQEYFAARYLVNDFDEAKTLLRKHRHMARWEEPLRLAIATQTGANAAKLIRAALWHKDGANPDTGYEPSAHEAILRRDLLLTSLCLGDCAPIEPTLAREVMEELLAICLNHNGKGFYEPLRRRVHVTLPALKSGEIGQEMQRQLLTALQDENWAVRGRAAISLGRLELTFEIVVASLLAVLHDKHPFVRQSAATALGRLGQSSKNVVAPLLAILYDEQGDVRGGVAEALGQLGYASEKEIYALLNLLHDRDPYVRQSAATALERIGHVSEDVVSALLPMLKDQFPFVRRSVAGALGQIRQASEPVVKALMDALKDEHWEVRQSVVRALERIEPSSTSIVNTLLNCLASEDAELQVGAADALGRLGQASEGSNTLLLKALQDEEWSIRRRAAEGIGALGKASEPVVKALMDALKDEHWEVRQSVMWALGQSGQNSTPVVDALFSALTDKEAPIRWSAAAALGRLGQVSELVVKALTDALRDEEWTVRHSAAGALGQLGQASEATINALLAALQDKEGSVRDAAWEALWTLTSDRAVGSVAASE